MISKIYDPERTIFLNSRILFIIDGCPYCRMYYNFIGTVNKNLPWNKKIDIVNCTQYHDNQILTDNRIPLFFKYYGGSYPALFINGGIIRGANSTEELKAWLYSRLYDEFIIDEKLSIEIGGVESPLMFDKKCHFKKKGWFNKEVICK